MHLSYDEIIAGKDRESLIVYQHCLNDYKVDVDLVASLLHKIVVTQPEGRVSVLRNTVTECQFGRLYKS